MSDAALESESFAALASARERRKLLRRALSFTRPHRVAIVLVLIATLATAALSAVEPLILRSVFDALTDRHDLQAALGAVLGICVVAIAREATTALTMWLVWRTRLRIHHALLDAAVDRLQRLPIEFHRDEGAGATMTKLERGITGFVITLGEIAFSFLPAVGYLVIALIVMARLDWRLTLLVAVLAPLPALIAAWAAPHQTKRESSLLLRWSRVYGRFNEVLVGLLTVRSFATEDRERQRFLRDVGGIFQLVDEGVRFDSRASFAQAATMAFGRVAVIAAGAVLVSRGQISIGTMVAFVGFVGGAFAPVQSLSGMYKNIRIGMVALHTVFSILDGREHIADAPHARDLGPIAGRVDFEGVRFGYRPDQPVLDGIDLHIAAGERLAIVGPSGSGKSTLTALLQRFYDPQEGVARIDGVDVRALKQSMLRRQIGVVMQEPLLFNDTVAANIAYARPDATEQEIEAAAAAANADGFIAALPKRYATAVGERGGLLSAGERQRVAIARALLNDPAILVLDEATSALDAESEALVQGAIDKLARDRTTIIVAHRLATVVSADRIVVVSGGRIVEQGKHDELMRANGQYASLVAKQSRGMLPG